MVEEKKKDDNQVDEAKQMEADLTKALDKEKAELVSKTIADTKDRLKKEKELRGRSMRL